MGKYVLGVFDPVRHKPSCTATKDVWRLKIWMFGSKGVVLSIQQRQRRCRARLICVFVFAYVEGRLSHDAAHIASRLCTINFKSAACLRRETKIFG